MQHPEGREVLLPPDVLEGLERMAAVARLAATHALQSDVAAAVTWIESFRIVELDFDEPRYVAEVTDPRGSSRAYAGDAETARRRAFARFLEDVGHTDVNTTEIAVRRIGG